MLFTGSLKKNADFKDVYSRGRSAGNRCFIIYSARNEESGKNRLGISVSKKVGNSVVRHRVKRLIKESYRLNETCFVEGLDMIVIARQSAKECNFFEIESALLHLAKKEGLLKEKQ